MNLIVLEQPPFEPVTLSEAKEKLRLIVGDESPDSHPHDTMIERHIKTARLQAEKDTGRAFIQQQLRLFTDRFPYPYAYWYADRWYSYQGPGYIQLLRPPIISVDEVSYYDEVNVLQTVDTGSYYATDSEMPRLYLSDGFSVPAIYGRHDAVRVDYTVGYAPTESPAATQADYAANVPEDIKDAILLGVELLYRSMDAKTREVTEAARMSLLTHYQTHPFA